MKAKTSAKQVSKSSKSNKPAGKEIKAVEVKSKVKAGGQLSGI
jgi:hypothetical protein